ncbi:uncharacterized protein LOC124277801 [Haliotis rubra]|uniref:uncharacterized protein LOC124277801 n=1 Tax=Haliotis rubra TaxID=36100 RepID=UPI001EE54F70|nr:uncharacterized protein LOC124277801 [Haliotis rubra]
MAGLILPGHNAKFGSYSMMDLKTKKVVHSNEVKNSNAMEKEGFQRSVQLLQAEGLTLSTLITDRHPQIQKLVRETMPAVSHFYDVWHVAKGLRKKLEALAKEKDCEALSPWIKSIVNHLYWCAASTPHGDPELVLEKWRSVINHVQKNIHVGHGAKGSTNASIPGRKRGTQKKWLKCGTKAAEKLGLLLEKPRLLKDVRKISPQYQTSAVESFHRVIINFAPKMVGFSYMGMLSRLYLSAMHFNENGTRPQAHDDNGEFKFRIKYKKYRRDNMC